MRTPWIAALAAATSAILALASTASALEVAVRVVPEAVFEGETAQVEVELGAIDRQLRTLSLAAPQGFAVEGPNGPKREVSIVNGARSEKVTFWFVVRPPAGTEGVFPLGPLELGYADGAKEQRPVASLTVGRRAPKGARMEVEVAPAGGPILMPFTAIYRILYSGDPLLEEDSFGRARNPFGLKSLKLPILTRTDVKVEPMRARSGPATELTIEGESKVYLQEGSRTTPEGTYRTLEMALRITPLVPGAIDLEGSAGIALVTGHKAGRDVFGRTVRVADGEVVGVSSGPRAYVVAALPEAGRPPGFAGAVGRFEVAASVEKRVVNAFDPIEVELVVRGEGVLERVALPNWREVEEITRSFEVAESVDPGTLRDGPSGKEKVFRAVLRARSGAVKELPALPFPFYDPTRQAYAIARTQPIPLEVREVRTLTGADAVGGAPASTAAAREEESGPRTVRALDGLPPLYTEEGPRRRIAPRGVPILAWLVLLLPPLGLALREVLARRKRMAEAGLAPLEALRASASAAAADSDALFRALSDFLRARLALPAGETTGSEVAAALRARGVPAESIDAIVRALDALIERRYGAKGGDLPDVVKLAEALDAHL